MNKFSSFLILLLFAPIIGAIYGIVHDQITYTLSNEYYTKFKFIQFGLIEEGQLIDSPRLLVSIVGVMATWWMGLIIGSVLGLVSLTLKNGKEMIQIVPKAILVTIYIAFSTGIIGFIYGKFYLSSGNLDWNIPKDLNDKINFIAVGSMHNFSYLGGLIGLIAGIIYIVKQQFKKTPYNNS
jgi:hypothetical protein